MMRLKLPRSQWVGGLVLLWFMSLLQVEGGTTLYSTSDLAPPNYDQLNALLKNYIKELDNAKAQSKQISGQVNLRSPRSELVGDMAHALRLYQLAELDRMYGAKSRPRFGKRGGEITPEYAPTYGSGLGGYESPLQNDISDGRSSSRDEEQR